MGQKKQPLLTEEVQRGLRTGCSVALTMFLGFGVILPLVGGARCCAQSERMPHLDALLVYLLRLALLCYMSPRASLLSC